MAFNKRVEAIEEALKDWQPETGVNEIYPTSPHEWLSTKAMDEKDRRIEELGAENTRLTANLERVKRYYKYSTRRNGEIIKNLDAQIERLTAENTRLTESLAKCSGKRTELVE